METNDLQFLHGEHTARCVATVDKVFSGYQTLQYMTAGGVELLYDDQQHILQGQWFWPAWDGPVIRFHVAPGHEWWEHRYIAFRGRLAQQWLASGLFPTSPQPAPRSRQHAAAFDQMTRLAHTPGRWDQLRAINLLEALLLELAQARDAQTIDDPLIDQVLSHLQQAALNAEGEIDYARIASEMNIGFSTLRRRFAQRLGMSMHQWVLDHRLSQARTWLGQSDMPIKTIARKLGYRDVYFFSRQFHQKVGVPPGAYRTSRQR